jgi:integrase
MARKKGQTETEALLTIPHTEIIGGKPYVRICYCDVDGKRKSKTRRVNTVEEAVSAISELKVQVGLAEPSPSAGETMNFAELLALYARRHPRVQRCYLDMLGDFFRFTRIRSISYSDLKRFKIAREAVKTAYGCDRKTATIKKEIDSLRSVLRYALGCGLLEKDPFRDGPRLLERNPASRRQASATPEEEACILAQCVGSHEYLVPLIIASGDTGLGKRDLLALTWRNVDLIDRLLILSVGRQHFRFIGLTARLFAELQRRWLRSERNPDLKVFGDVKDFTKWYRTVCRQIGVPHLSFRDLAKGYTADLAAAGISPKAAKERAGLIDLETGEIDPNLDQRNARRIAEALDALRLARLRSVYECVNVAA